MAAFSRFQATPDDDDDGITFSTVELMLQDALKEMGFIFFDSYQVQAVKTAIYPGQGEPAGLMYVALGVNGEAGEIAEKVKKIQRDLGGVATQVQRDAIRKEVGDVLWYLAMVANELEFKLSDAAVENIQKLADRHARNAIGGSGDDR